MVARRARIVLVCAEPGSRVARLAEELGLSRITARNRPASAAGWPPRRAASGCAAPWSSRRAAAPAKDSYFARLRGPDKAAVAVAHSLLDVIWHLLTTGEVFTDLGADHFTSRQDKEHQAA